MSDGDSAVLAIRSGDVEALDRILHAHPELTASRPDGERTLAHVATDWPGHWPRAAETIACLARHGAPLGEQFLGRHAETALHWAASSNDVAAIDALLDHGVDIDTPGSIFADGGAIADAVGFGNWAAARRLFERGAAVNYWQAAALGLLDRVRELAPRLNADEVTNAFWSACWGGQLATAQYLMERGADIDWVGHDGMTPMGAARRQGADAVVTWLQRLGATG